MQHGDEGTPLTSGMLPYKNPHGVINKLLLSVYEVYKSSIETQNPSSLGIKYQYVVDW